MGNRLKQHQKQEPLYLRTLWRYTNPVIIIIIISHQEKNVKHVVD